MRIKKIGMLVLALVLGIPTLSLATSWSHRWIEDGIGNFDKMEIFMISSSADFNASGFANFTYNTWNGKLINPDYALASGKRITQTSFDTLFNSDPSQPLVFDFLAWRGTTLLERVQVTWDNSDWSQVSLARKDDPAYNRSPFTDPNGSGMNPNPVPEPVSLLLLGSGLMGLVGWGQKRILKKGTI